MQIQISNRFDLRIVKSDQLKMKGLHKNFFEINGHQF